MQEIKDILEKIQRPRNKDELLPAWWIRDNILAFVDQALAKLKEEPEQGEFVKECREIRKRGASAGQWEYATKMMEACEIIDQLQSENKKLVEGQQAKKEAGS